MGPSGSGKTTLLNCISCYIPADSGQITLGTDELARLDEDALACVEEVFQALHAERDENFGNAREVRNVFEKAVARQADRVAQMGDPGREELMALRRADLEEERGNGGA